MTKKPAIKRVGSFLPTICLLIFLFFCTLAIWLSTAGLPRFAIDKIEEAIAAEGVPIKIGKVKFNIFRRAALVADDVRVFARPDDKTPVIKAECISATFAPLKLFIGEIEPKSLTLKNGKIAIPVSDTEEYQELAATQINFSAAFHNQYVSLRTSDLKLQGIPIHIKGAFDIEELLKGDSAEEEQEKLVIPAIIKTCQSVVDRTYHMIEEQHWAPNEFPELHLNIAAGKEVKLQIQARAPKYDIAEFCFRDSEINLDYEGDRVIINNLAFKTVKPDARVQLKGGYELETRKLTLTLESDAALLEMTKALADGETLDLLKKFRHNPEDNPHVSLSVNAIFEEDFSLHEATLNGELEQHNLHIGDSTVDHLFISFFYNNGNFNVDNLTLKFPDGKIKCMAIANEGKGHAEIQADLPIIRIISLVNEFLTEPVIVPMGLKLGNNLKLQAKADLSMPQFKPGDSYEQHFIPEVKALQAQLSLQQLGFMSYQLNAPVLTFSCNKGAGVSETLLQKAHSINLDIEAETFQCQLDDEKTLHISAPKLGLNIQQADTTSSQGGLSFEEAQADFSCNTFDFNGLTTQNFNIESKVHGFSHSDIGTGVKQAELALTVGKMIKEQLEIEAIKLTAQAHAHDGKLMPETLTEAEMQMEVEGIQYESQRLGRMTAGLKIPEHNEGAFNFMFTPAAGTEEHHATLNANVAIEDESTLHISNISAALPCSNLQHITEAFGIQLKDIEMPHNVTATGNVCLDLNNFNLNQADIKVNVPQLVRTPHQIESFRGKKITVDVDADIHAKGTTDGSIDYRGDVQVKHTTGTLNATLSGNTARNLHAIGTNTIRPDIVDELMDYDEAHDILRDFRFTDNSKSKIENIVVDVKYDNGLDVAVDCDITLHNTQYQLCGIEEDEQGHEILNKQLGKLPFTSVVKALTHLRVDYREDIEKDGKILPTVIDITMTDVTLEYDNLPWLKLQDFTKLGLNKQGPGVKKHKTSVLKGDKVLIDIENGAVRLTNVQGNVYPGYALGMFYADLRDYLSILLTPYPTGISTEYCQFPIYSDSTEKMKGHIRVQSAQLTGLDFLGTQIPMTRFTGFVNLTDDYIYLDRMNALCWDGTVNAAIKIGISKTAPAFDGEVKAQNMDLKKIAKAYGADMESALCEANIRFRSPTSDINDIKAYGAARIVNGNLLTLSIFQPIGAFVSDVTGNIKELDESVRKQKTDSVLRRLSKTTGSTINAIGNQLDRTAQYLPGYNHVFAYDLQNAFLKFVIENGHFKTENLKALGYNLKVTGVLDINLNNMEIYGNLWPQVSSLPTILLSPITFLSDFMLDIVIFGEVDDLKWEFRLDPRVGNSSPKTADSGTDKECPTTPGKRKATAKKR